MILDIRDISFFSPVDVTFHGGFDDVRGGKSFEDSQGEVGFSEFLGGQVHELVEVKGIGLIGLLIEFLDLVVVVIEDGESIPVLIRGCVLLVVLLLPVRVEVIDLRIYS